MKNITPTKESDLLTKSQDLAAGETLIGNDLGVAQNKAAKILADVNEVGTKRAEFQIAKDQLDIYRSAVRVAYDNGKSVMSLGRDVFKPQLGNQYSDSWKLLGFDRSLAMPPTPAQMQFAVQTFQKYLASNPTKELPVLNLTAAHLQTLLDQISTARGALYNQEMVVSAAKDARDEAVGRLQRRYRGFIDELGQLIGPMDQRWKVFGLNVPDAPAVPEIVTGLKAALIGPTAVALKWNAAARADYYRVFKKVRGVDSEFVPVGSPADLDFTIEDLPSNATIDICVTAVNGGGECPQSEKVTVTTHA